MVGRKLATRRRMAARVIALLLASTAFVQQAVSAPADIFMSSAPVLGAPAPKARELKDGDASVSTQTGALNYAYPIQVPPGRNGLAPQLALTYTSQGAVYGSIASGWSFPIPEIREDTSQGRLATRTIITGDARADDRFTSSLAGEALLVKVPIAPALDAYAVYLAQGDSSGTRYERLSADVSGQYPNGYWRVRTLDGTTMLFGEPARTAYGGPPCAHASEDYAPLTTVRDQFGNEVRYEYSPFLDPNECVLKQITWGYNTGAGVTGAFAKVEFTYNETLRCTLGEAAYAGAQLDYRSGRKIVSGASKLVEIRATAFPTGLESSPSHTRVIDLAYWEEYEQCNLSHAPVRLLKSIEERAWGTNAPLVTLPKVTFDYGTPAVSVTTTVGGSLPWNIGSNQHTGNAATFGWGRRPNPSADDHWPTVEAMMIDFDGDGLLDRLTSSSQETTSGTCSFSFQRNQGPPLGSPNATQTFATQGSTYPLPRLRWHTDGSVDGSPTASFGTPNFEHCALNGQVTSYRNTLAQHTTACHDLSQCQNSTTPGLESQQFCYSPGEFGLECPGLSTVPDTYRTYLAYRWLDLTADGLPDLVAAVHGNIRAYDIVNGGDSSQSIDSTPFGVPWPACPTQMDRCEEVTYECGTHSCVPVVTPKPCHQISTTTYSVSGSPPASAMERQPYQRCEGLYPWLIYPNTGGALASTPIVKYSPVPLESDSGDSNLGGPSITAAEQMIADVDGDGIIDVATLQTGMPSWQVWRGDGTGGFGPTRYSMVPRWPYPAFFSNDAPNSVYGSQIQTASGLVDLNGDGLAEHWLLGSSSTNISWANGTGFETAPGSGGGVVGTFDIGEKPGQDTYFSASAWQGTPPRVAAGTLTSKRRVVDVDNDGRVDLVDFSNPLIPRVRFNVGADFLGLVTYPGVSAGAVRKVESISDALDVNRPWELHSDLIDLDGDGIAESASTTSGFSRSYHSTVSGPPRLLKSIANGRGATTTITYASMHDTSTVLQSPSSMWPDGRPKATPVNQWVVKSLRTVDQFSGADSTTTQFYKNPRHGKNDEERYGFRGFEEVSTTTPAGAQIVEKFDYETDWSGRLIEKRVHPQPNVAEVRTIDRATWIPRTLFGAHTAYHPSTRHHYTCANTDNVTSCVNAAVAHTKTEIFQTAYTNNATQEVLWADTETRLQAADSLADGDRRTVQTFTLVSTPTQHQFRPNITTREHRVAGAWTVFGRRRSNGIRRCV